jgi:hypothetical protein
VVVVAKTVSGVGFGEVTLARERDVLIRWLTALKTAVTEDGISLDLTRNNP